MALIVPRHTGEMKYIMTAMEVYSNHGDWLSNDDFIDRQSRKLIAEGYDSVINSDRTHYTKDAELVRYFGFAERKVQGDKYSDVRLTSQGEEFLTAWKNSNMDECQELIMQALEHVTFGRNNEGCGSDSNVEAPKVCVMSSLILDGITKKELAYILDALDRGVSYSQILITIIQCRILGKKLPPYTVTEDQKYVQFMRNIGFFDDTQDSRGIIIKLSNSVRSRFLDRIKHLSLYNNEEVEFITNETSGYDLFFNKPIQQIIYGAPGTGKSFEISKITEQIDELTEANSEEPRVFRTTFHPDSDYSTFVGAYKPEKTKHPVRNVAGNVVIEDGMEVQEDIITYNFCPQAFAKAYIRAWQTKEPVILVIEEINRGNCAQIFGDLFQLLDRDGDNESKYPIDPDTDFGKFIAEKLEGFSVPELIKQGKKLKLPANLYIWATMNTSDQSLFPIDSAFKRRWDWRYIKIAQPKKEGTDEKFDWKIEGDIDWWQFIKKINDIILRMTNSADKQLGYFFAKANNEDVITYDCFVSKVCFYLWNDIFKTYAVDGMENSLFKYTYIDEDDSIEKTGVLDFTKFFDEEGKVVPAVVEQFIQNVMNWQGETK